MIGLLGGCATRPVEPANAPGWDLADAALANGAPQLALTITQKVLQERPNDPYALQREGRAYAALNESGEAEDAFRRAISLDPGFVPALMDLGKLLLFADPEQARELFVKALKYAPHDAAALNDQGIALDLLRRHTDAQDRYRQALMVDHDLVSAQVNLALSLGMSGDTGAGIRLIRPLAEGPASTPRIRRNMALLLARSGNEQEAEQALQKDLSADEAAKAVGHYREMGSDAPPLHMAPN